MKGVKGLDVRLEKRPLDEYLDQSDGPWVARLPEKGTFHTFTRPRKFKKEPTAAQAGRDSADTATLKRWRDSSWEAAPYQLTEDKRLWKGEEWRQLRAGERKMMLGFL